MNIEYFSEKYRDEIKKMIQSLREDIVSLEFWDDDLILYDTTNEAEKSIQSFILSEICIFIAIENEEAIGYVIGKIRTDSSNGSKIEKYGSVGQIFVVESQRGKGIGKNLLERIEQEFSLFAASHVMISVFAPNTRAHQFYKNRGFEDRLVTLAKPISR